MNTKVHKTTGQITLTCVALVALASHWLIGAANAQSFTTLKSFGILTNVSGLNPFSQLVQGPDAMLYGTARAGEGNVAGTVFKVQPDGSGFTLLKSFTNSVEGANPWAGLTLSGSVLYGTTYSGGSSGYGTVFQVNTDGTGYTVLKNFSALSPTYTNSDGANPTGGLMLSGSVLYGTTAKETLNKAKVSSCNDYSWKKFLKRRRFYVRPLGLAGRFGFGGGVRLPFFTASIGLFPGCSCFLRRAGSAGDDHVGQTKQCVELMPVLGQSPIPHFPMSE